MGKKVPHGWAPTRATVCAALLRVSAHTGRRVPPSRVLGAHTGTESATSLVWTPMEAYDATPRGWASTRGTEAAAPCRWAPTRGTKGAAPREWAPIRGTEDAALRVGAQKCDRMCYSAQVGAHTGVKSCHPAYLTRGRHLLYPCSPQKSQEKGRAPFSEIFCTFSGPMGAAAPYIRP